MRQKHLEKRAKANIMARHQSALNEFRFTAAQHTPEGCFVRPCIMDLACWWRAALDALRISSDSFRTSSDILNGTMADREKNLKCEVCRSRFHAAHEITKAVLAERARHIKTPMVGAEL